MKFRKILSISLILSLGITLLGDSVLAVCGGNCAACEMAFPLDGVGWPIGETPKCVRVVFSDVSLCPEGLFWDYPSPNNRSFYLMQSETNNCKWDLVPGFSPIVEPDGTSWSLSWEPNKWNADLDEGLGDFFSDLWLTGAPSASDPFAYYFRTLSWTLPRWASTLPCQMTNMANTNDCDWNDAYGGTATVTEVKWPDDATCSDDFYKLRCLCCRAETGHSGGIGDPCAPVIDRRILDINCPGGYFDLYPDSFESQQTSPYDVAIDQPTTFRIDVTGGPVESSPSGDDAQSADIYYVLDRSDSMSIYHLGKTKINWAKDALRQIYQFFKDYNEGGLNRDFFLMGLASFNHEPDINSGLQDTSSDNFSYDDVVPCGCTGIEAGLIHPAVESFYDPYESCEGPEVKKVMIVASDGAENRLVNSTDHFPSPEFDDLRNNYNNVKNGAAINGAPITFYTIGIGGSVDGSHLRDIAYNWGTGQGAYYQLPAIGTETENLLYEIYEDIAEIYISDDPASAVVVRIVLTADFEFISSTPAPSYQDGNIIEWNIGGLASDETKSIMVTVKPISGSGVTDVIDTDPTQSGVFVHNKCGVFQGVFGPITANIIVSTDIDIGLRVFNGTEIVAIAAEPGIPTSPLRIAKNGTIYGIILVNPGDLNDSGVRIETSSGIKSLKKLFSYSP